MKKEKRRIKTKEQERKEEKMNKRRMERNETVIP